MIHDVIVVGSGPGGSIAATTLAAQGKSVLLVDRQSFPRDKVCGDGMPLRVMAMMQALGIDIPQSGLTYQRISQLCINAPSGHSLVTYEKSNGTFSMAAPRLSFDNVLHQHALKSGAKFELMDVDRPLLSGDRVVGVIERRGKEFIEHEAKVVIAADGASSSIARALQGRVAETSETAIAIRAYARVRQALSPQVTFYFYDYLLPGYAWLFPVGPDRVNIGVYLLDQEQYKQRGQSLKTLLETFIQKMRPDCPMEIEPTTMKSWPLPLWKNPQSRVSKGVFLVGDAGRFIDALTGGGIYPAMLTGQLAAEQAIRVLEGVETAYQDYDQAWRQRVAPELRRADLVQRFIASKRRVFNGIFAFANVNPTVKNRLLNALAGQHS